MLCDNCNKNNENGAVKCAFCGAPMPSASACGGFADILKYGTEPSAAPAPSSSGVSEEFVRAVSIKANSALKLANNSKLLCLIAVAASAVMLIASIILWSTVSASLENCRDNIDNLESKYHPSAVEDETDGGILQEGSTEEKNEDGTEDKTEEETEDKTDKESGGKKNKKDTESDDKSGNSIFG